MVDLLYVWISNYLFMCLLPVAECFIGRDCKRYVEVVLSVGSVVCGTPLLDVCVLLEWTKYGLASDPWEARPGDRL